MADSGRQAATTGSNEPQISDDLLRQVADRVFQLLLEEARIDNERRRTAGNHRRFGQGGR